MEGRAPLLSEDGWQCDAYLALVTTIDTSELGAQGLELIHWAALELPSVQAAFDG